MREESGGVATKFHKLYVFPDEGTRTCVFRNENGAFTEDIKHLDLLRRDVEACLEFVEEACDDLATEQLEEGGTVRDDTTG